MPRLGVLSMLFARAERAGHGRPVLRQRASTEDGGRSAFAGLTG
jgi:hypothetical protein